MIGITKEQLAKSADELKKDDIVKFVNDEISGIKTCTKRGGMKMERISQIAKGKDGPIQTKIFDEKELEFENLIRHVKGVTDTKETLMHKVIQIMLDWETVIDILKDDGASMAGTLISTKNVKLYIEKSDTKCYGRSLNTGVNKCLVAIYKALSVYGDTLMLRHQNSINQKKCSYDVTTDFKNYRLSPAEWVHIIKILNKPSKIDAIKKNMEIAKKVITTTDKIKQPKSITQSRTIRDLVSVDPVKWEIIIPLMPLDSEIEFTKDMLTFRFYRT